MSKRGRKYTYRKNIKKGQAVFESLMYDQLDEYFKNGILDEFLYGKEENDRRKLQRVFDNDLDNILGEEDV